MNRRLSRVLAILGLLGAVAGCARHEDTNGALTFVVAADMRQYATHKKQVRKAVYYMRLGQSAANYDAVTDEAAIQGLVLLR